MTTEEVAMNNQERAELEELSGIRAELQKSNNLKKNGPAARAGMVVELFLWLFVLLFIIKAIF